MLELKELVEAFKLIADRIDHLHDQAKMEAVLITQGHKRLKEMQKLKDASKIYGDKLEELNVVPGKPEIKYESAHQH